MLDKFKITNRVAIITGGGQGIGKGIASIFAEAGAYVVISDMIAETVQATAQELSEQGGNVLATVTDVRDSGQVAEMVKTNPGYVRQDRYFGEQCRRELQEILSGSQRKWLGRGDSGHFEKRFLVQ